MNIELKLERIQHSLLAKSFHWIFVFVFGYGVFKQIESKDQLNDIALLKSEMVFAIIFLIFLMVRFIYMKRTFITSLPPETSSIHRTSAQLVHISMYISFSVMAMSGLAIGFFFWLGFQDSNLIEFTIWIHELSFSIIIWLISVHVLAAIYHRIQNDFVWSSMVPFLKEQDKWKNDE